MSLRIPAGVVKILKSKSPPRAKFIAIQKFLTYRVHNTAGCFNAVLLCKGFVLKRNLCSDSHPDGNVRKDFAFITKMRSDPKTRQFFPEARLFRNVMVQERCDRNVALSHAYKKQSTALGAKLGVGDLHNYNIGWRVVKGKEPIPVFIDVGITRASRRKKKAVRKVKRLSWFLSESEANCYGISATKWSTSGY